MNKRTVRSTDGSIFIGCVISCLFLLIGVLFFFSDSVEIPGQWGTAEVTGYAANGFRMIFIFIGLMLHFYFYWGTDEELVGIGNCMSIICFVGVIVSCVLAVSGGGTRVF